MRRHLSTAVIVLVRCASPSAPSSLSSSAQVQRPEPWTPALSPEQAKAILVARAAIERQAKQADQPEPALMAFRATRMAQGWSVYVQFVGLWEKGQPMAAPGHFCVVTIDGGWNVARVMGGA